MTRIPDAPPPAPARRWHLGTAPWQSRRLTPPAPHARVLIDNDFSGDPDDLPQLVHHLLSPGVEIRGIIGSHLREGDGFDPGPGTAAHAVAVVHDVLARMGVDGAEHLVVEGADGPLPDRGTPRPSAASAAIIAEALREDTDLPLLYAAGGGLTDLASALLIEPRIASRMRLLWIGGPEHPGLAVPPPDAMPIEYNLLIDPAAAQVVFDTAELEIWQVPRDAYRRCLVSESELRTRLGATGPLGRHLYEEIALVSAAVGRPCASYALGDSPLVLFSALLSLFEPDASSSSFAVRPTPAVADDGSYRARESGDPAARDLRICTQVDMRLLLEDLIASLTEFEAWANAPA